ncbi:MAG TPA: ion transporter [Flavipsychrobacter sp.]|nr:ion transporter [Flavipsychrobacter sp.]
MTQKQSHIERSEFINQAEKLLEGPIVVLGFIWLILLIVEMTHGLSPFFKVLNVIIWAMFIVDFVLRFIIAPNKITFLKNDWLIALSLFIPAIRFIRIFRMIRILSVIQGTSIVTMMGSVNRSMRSLNATLRRRGFVYVIAIAIAVILLGAAGMYAFEKGQPGSFKTYADAVWWTTMLFITIGSEYWPHTPAGKTLSLLVSIFGFSVLGYITATLASFFVGRDAESRKRITATNHDILLLRKEIEKLSKNIDELKKGLDKKA